MQTSTKCCSSSILADITQLNDVIATLGRIVGVAKVTRSSSAEAEIIAEMSRKYQEITQGENSE